MLAVGALADDTTEKASVNKQAKRGILNIDQGSKIHKSEQPEQQLRGYVQPGHQYVAPSGSDSTYSVQVSNQKAVALPSKTQHDNEATVVYDDESNQISHHQTEHGYDPGFNHQGQQAGHEFHGCGGLVSKVSPLAVESHFLSTPVEVSHQVPVEVQHQVSVGVPHQVPVEEQHQVPVSVPHEDLVLQALRVPNQVSVEVSRSLEIPVQCPESVYFTETHEVQQPIPILVRVPSPSPIHAAHQPSLSIVTGYETGVGHNHNVANGIGQSLHRQHNLAGPEYSLYRNPVNFEVLELHSNAGSVVADQHINIGSQQYDFSGFENAFPNVYQGVRYGQHVSPPGQAKSTVLNNQHSGYHYDKPTEKFTF